MIYKIVAASDGIGSPPSILKYFDILTNVDKSADYPPGMLVYVKDVTGNSPNGSGIYTVQSSSFLGGSPALTRIVPVEPIPAHIENDLLGSPFSTFWLSGGVTVINFTDAGIGSPKQPILLPPTELTTNRVSIPLIGHGTLNYGETLNENLLRILENFASPTPPANPTIGQMWYNSDEATIRTYNGTSWIGGITIAPGASLILLDSESSPVGQPFVFTGDDADKGISFQATGSPAQWGYDLDDPLFRILNASGLEILKIEHGGSTTINGSLGVTGLLDSYFAGSLAVGTTSAGVYRLFVNGDTNIDGNLTVNNSLILLDILTVTGDTTLDGPVIVNDTITFNAGIDMNNTRITGVADPVLANDAVPKSYLTVSLEDLDSRKIDNYSNIPLTQVGDTIPEYLKYHIGETTRNNSIPWDNARPYWIQESNGVLVGLVPMYNGDDIRMCYVYSKSGRLDDIIFTGVEYRPACLSLASPGSPPEQWVSAITGGNIDGFTALVQESGGGVTTFWVTNNGTLDPALHTAVALTIGVGGVVTKLGTGSPDFWLTLDPVGTYASNLTFRLYDGPSGNSLNIFTGLFDWTTGITFANDTTTSPHGTWVLGDTVAAFRAGESLQYYYDSSTEDYIISTVMDIRVTYSNGKSYFFGVNVLFRLNPLSGTSPVGTMTLLEEPLNADATPPYVFTPANATQPYPIFPRQINGTYEWDPEQVYSMTTCQLRSDTNSVCISGMPWRNPTKIGGQVLTSVDSPWDQFLLNFGKQADTTGPTYWNSDTARINKYDGFQFSHISNATPLGSILHKATWVNENEVIFSADSMMPDLGDTIGVPTTKNGYTVRIDDPLSLRSVDTHSVLYPFVGYTGDFIELPESYYLDTMLLSADNVENWHYNTTAMDSSGRFEREYVVVTDTEIKKYSYNYQTRTTPVLRYTLDKVALATFLQTTIQADPQVGVLPYRQRVVMLDKDSAYNLGSPNVGNLLFSVGYVFNNATTTYYNMFTFKYNGIAFTKVSAYTTVDSHADTTINFMDSDNINPDLISGSCYYHDLSGNITYALQPFPVVDNQLATGYGLIKVVAIKVDSDNAATPGALIDSELAYDATNYEVTGHTISLHNLYGPGITFSGSNQYQAGLRSDQFGKIFMQYQNHTSVTLLADRLDACWADYFAVTSPSLVGLITINPPDNLIVYTGEVSVFIAGAYRVVPASYINLKEQFSTGSPPEWQNETFYLYAELTNNGPSIIVKNSITNEAYDSTLIGSLTTNSTTITSITYDTVTRIDDHKLSETATPNTIVLSDSEGKISEKWIHFPMGSDLIVDRDFIAADENTVVPFNAGVPLTGTMTLANSNNFPLGARIFLFRKGTGTATIAGSGGIFIRHAFSAATLRAQYSEGELLKISATEWLLSGDITS